MGWRRLRTRRIVVVRRPAGVRRRGRHRGKGLLEAVVNTFQEVSEPVVDGLAVAEPGRVRRGAVPVPAAAVVHACERGPGECVVGLPAVDLLHVPVDVVAGHQHRDGHARQVLEVIAVEPELGVVRGGAVTLGGVLQLLTLGEVAGQALTPVGVGVVDRRRDRQPEVEAEWRVDALVARGTGALVTEGLRGVEVTNAIRECVVVPAVDRRFRHDRHQVGRVHHRGGILRGAVVRTAEHADLAVGPGLRRDRLDHVVRGLLLTEPAVVPAATRVAGADHVGVGARVAQPVPVAGITVAAQDRVGRVGEDQRRRDDVARRVGGVLHLEEDVDRLPQGVEPGRRHDVVAALRVATAARVRRYRGGGSVHGRAGPQHAGC